MHTYQVAGYAPVMGNKLQKYGSQFLCSNEPRNIGQNSLNILRTVPPDNELICTALYLVLEGHLFPRH